MTRKTSTYARKRKALGAHYHLPINMRFNADVENKLQLIPHDSLANFKHGRQTEPDWHTLAARCNLGSTLARDHFEEATQTMNAAIDALASSWERFKRLGRMGMTGAEYNAVAAALVLTDDMQKLCTRRELDSAMTTVFQQAAIFKTQPKATV
jgi:hypothetical protein